MTTVREFQNLKPPRTFSSFPDVTDYCRKLFDTLYQARRGKIECIRELTLTASVASTTIRDHRISNQSGIFFCPRTANAAAELAAGTLYITEANQTNGQAVVTHANNAQTDRTYLVLIIG